MTELFVICAYLQSWINTLTNARISFHGGFLILSGLVVSGRRSARHGCWFTNSEVGLARINIVQSNSRSLLLILVLARIFAEPTITDVILHSKWSTFLVHLNCRCIIICWSWNIFGVICSLSTGLSHHCSRGMVCFDVFNTIGTWSRSIATRCLSEGWKEFSSFYGLFAECLIGSWAWDYGLCCFLPTKLIKFLLATETVTKSITP